MSERKLFNDELLLDQTTLAWEQAAGSASACRTCCCRTPSSSWRKQTSLLPQAHEEGQHLEFCQAKADMQEGRTTQDKNEIFELAALAKDLHEGMSETDMEEESSEPNQLTQQLEHYLPKFWFRGEGDSRRRNLMNQHRMDWDGAIVQAFNELAQSSTRSTTARRRRPRRHERSSQFRMETELNAVAVTRMFIERARLASSVSRPST